MPADRGLMLAFAAAVLLPVAAGWALSHRWTRLRSASVIALIGGSIATYLAGPKLGLLTATWCFGLAYLASARGFVPADVGEVAEAVKDSGRWWR